MPRIATDQGTRSTTGNRAWRRVMTLLALPLLLSVLAACQSNTGISREDAAAIKDQIEQVASRLEAVEERLMDLSQSTSDAPPLLISEVRAVTSDVGAAKTILADVTSQLEVSVPEESAQPTDDLLDEPLPDLDSNPVDPLPDLDSDPIDPLPDQGTPEPSPDLDAGPDGQDAAPFGDEQP